MRGQKIIRQRETLSYIRYSKIRIGYCMSDNPKQSNGKTVYADCSKVPPLYKAWIPYDFIIRFYEPNVMFLTEDQQDMLMYHELLHVGLDNNGGFKINPHDIEDFRAIIDEYGLDWSASEDGDINAEES